MLLKQLRRCHALYDAETIGIYRDLFEGGARMRRNVQRHLPQHDVEPRAVWDRRCRQAHYFGYISSIIHYYASWLQSSPLTFKSDPDQVDPYWSDFKEDCTGTGTDLDLFIRRVFIEACVARDSYWRVIFPSTEAAPSTRAEWEAQKLGYAILDPVQAETITNWRADDRGEWEWVLECSKREEILELSDEELTVTERWILWRADGTAQAWEAVYVKSKPPLPTDAIPEVAPPLNPIGAIPIIKMTMPSELWIGNLLASGQLEHFRRSNALAWALDRTAYAMPVFNLKTPQKPPKMGAGYYLMLGIEEQVTWPAPPSAPFQMMSDQLSTIQEEMYRVSHQLAMAADNSASMMGRSGDSKNSDNAATELVLAAFGRIVRDPVERTFQLITRGRGEEIDWHVGGMDNYRLPDPKSLIENAIALETLRIPSVTLRRAVMTDAGLSVLPGADEPTKKMIRDEIEAGVNAEDTQVLHDEKAAKAAGAIEQASMANGQGAGVFGG